MEFDNVQGWLGVTTPAVAQTWKYVVGVRNGANQYLYVDGLLADGTITVNQAAGRRVSNYVTIGRISVVTGGTGHQGSSTVKSMKRAWRMSRDPRTG